MHLTISPTGLSPPTVGLPRPFGYHDLSIMKVLQPRLVPVWALPTSLAASGYTLAPYGEYIAI